jgi:hypothetical protein
MQFFTCNPSVIRSPASQLIHSLALALLLELLEVGVAELVHQAERNARVLEHVLKRKVLDQVVGAVNVVVRELKRRLDDKGRRVARLGGRRVVRARIAALCLDVGDLAVL